MAGGLGHATAGRNLSPALRRTALFHSTAILPCPLFLPEPFPLSQPTPGRVLIRLDPRGRGGAGSGRWLGGDRQPSAGQARQLTIPRPRWACSAGSHRFRAGHVQRQQHPAGTVSKACGFDHGLRSPRKKAGSHGWHHRSLTRCATDPGAGKTYRRPLKAVCALMRSPIAQWARRARRASNTKPETGLHPWFLQLPDRTPTPCRVAGW